MTQTQKSRRQSLQNAVKRARAGALPGIWSLAGCPVGGWAETDQARRRMLDVIPRKEERSYTLNDLIDALYTVDHANRYRTRPA